VIIPSAKVAIFVNGDFWHGWRFPAWSWKLQPKWREKIAGNRRRDRCNTRSLQRKGWTVLRIWQHEVERNIDRAVARVLAALAETGQLSRPRRFITNSTSRSGVPSLPT
jgi:DNA mismatch endonuclease (patch repair protein)